MKHKSLLCVVIYVILCVRSFITVHTASVMSLIIDLDNDKYVNYL